MVRSAEPIRTEFQFTFKAFAAGFELVLSVGFSEVIPRGAEEAESRARPSGKMTTQQIYLATLSPGWVIRDW